MRIYNFVARRRVLLAVFLFLTMFSVSSLGVTKRRRITSGVWGGEHIRLEATSQNATIEYDCAHGTIDGPLLVDSHGKFKVKGTHVREHGGPIRSGESGDAHPALYSGSTNGKQMTLTVALSDTKESLGTFTLIRGQEGRLWKCK